MSPTQSANTPQPPAAPQKSGTSIEQKCDELVLLINSCSPIVTVETSEEDRIEYLVTAAATKLGVPAFTWTVTAGLAKVGGSPIYKSDDPEQALSNIAEIGGDAIFLLKDFARYCDKDRISRRLLDLADKFRKARRSIIISATSMQLPAELLPETVEFKLGYPGADELLACIREVLADATPGHRIPVTLDAAGKAQLARNLVGLTEQGAIARPA